MLALRRDGWQPETQELTQFGGGIKTIAQSASAPALSSAEGVTSKL